MIKFICLASLVGAIWFFLKNGKDDSDDDSNGGNSKPPASPIEVGPGGDIEYPLRRETAKIRTSLHA